MVSLGTFVSLVNLRLSPADRVNGRAKYCFVLKIVLFAKWKYGSEIWSGIKSLLEIVL
jgi:hypothetical protein